MTSTDSSAVLPSDYTFQASDKGVHIFTKVTLNSPSTQTITVTDSQNGFNLRLPNCDTSQQMQPASNVTPKIN